MADANATHEWRIGALERRVEAVESKINTAIYLLVANMGGIVLMLVRVLWFGKP